MRNLLLLVVAIALVMFSATSTYAETKDDVCETLVDATPGLYGLCVAFCIAHPPGESGTLDLSNPQTRILRAYNQKKTYEDPDMPCFQGCPCFSVEDAEFTATHENYYQCIDNFQVERNGTWYESWKAIMQAGDIDQNGVAQTSADVSAYEIAPGELTCNWDYTSVSPTRKLQRHWFSPYEEDRVKFEDCQEIIDHVVESESLECETNPECERRILIDYPSTGEKPTLIVNGILINDPEDECINNAPFAKIEWYWGDGSVDIFTPMSDGFIYPFPNSHTYTETGLFVWMMYGFDDEGKILSTAGNFYFNW